MPSNFFLLLFDFNWKISCAKGVGEYHSQGIERSHTLSSCVYAESYVVAALWEYLVVLGTLWKGWTGRSSPDTKHTVPWTWPLARGSSCSLACLCCMFPYVKEISFLLFFFFLFLHTGVFGFPNGACETRRFPFSCTNTTYIARSARASSRQKRVLDFLSE